MRFPLNGTLELTARCNLGCKMCFIRLDNKRIAKLGERERTSEEWIQMAQEMQEAGVGSILLTGGEPLLRPDFADIYKAMAQMGFMLTLYTNATLVSDEIMEVFQTYPPHSIGITVYGASPETYEKVTGSAKAYYSMLEGVDKLRQLPSSLAIRTTIIKDNLADLEEMTSWAYHLQEEIDFDVSRIVTKAIRGGIADIESCRLSVEESAKMIRHRTIQYKINPLKQFLGQYPELLDTMDMQSLFEQTEEKCSKTEHTLYGCSAGMTSFTITWDGKLIGCQMLSDAWTLPFEEGFLRAWDSFLSQYKIPKLPEECIGCDVRCNACPAARLAETGAFDRRPEYICKESQMVNEMEDELIEELKRVMRKEVCYGEI